MHVRIQPKDVYEPVKGLYTQVIACVEGPRFEIAGTLPYLPDGSLEPELVQQCIVMMENLRASLESVDLVPSDVVRIQVYTTRMDEFLKKAIGIVFGFFGDERPTSTLVEISRLANPAVLIEMDASAVRAPR